MLGHLVPRNHDQEMELDINNGNNRCKQSETLELGQIHEYGTFLDKGKNVSILDGHNKIKVYLYTQLGMMVGINHVWLPVVILSILLLTVYTLVLFLYVECSFFSW